MTRRRGRPRGRRQRVSARVADIDRRRKRTWVQLGLSIMILVVLIVFWRELSDGAAGCFNALSGQPDGSLGFAPDAGRTKPVAPSVRVKLPDPGPRPAAADAGPGR